MSESGDYDPGPWRGYDFSTARKEYDRHAGRSYSQASTNRTRAEDLVPSGLETQSESPLVIAVDVTASMRQWPSIIFSKLPYLENEGKEYLGKSLEISFAAVGDAYSDKYPLQIRPFVKGRELESQLKKLIIESKGGMGIEESYDLAALYYANNVKMPNAIKPMMIFIGDEAIYEKVDRLQARDRAYVKIDDDVRSKDVFDNLKRKFSVYLIRKPYDFDGGNTDARIQSQWENILGPDRVVLLPDPNRVVDVAFGIFARETSRIKYFVDEINGRQKPEQVDVVMKSLKITQNPKKKKKEDESSLEGRSITFSRTGKNIKELT